MQPEDIAPVRAFVMAVLGEYSARFAVGQMASRPGNQRTQERVQTAASRCYNGRSAATEQYIVVDGLTDEDSDASLADDERG